MTTIPEELNEDIDVMDFVNWDAAAASTGFDLPISSEGAENLPDAATAPGPSIPDDPSMMDLVFGDVEGDDWSYWALQHYESTQLQQDADISTCPELDSEEVSPGTSQFAWETPEAPCTNCSRWAYHCKRIREGKYRGYCTSCVALRRQCSFGPSTNSLASEGGSTFPANPWPTMGDRPETSILHEDELAAIASSGPSAPPRIAVAGMTPLSPRPQHPPKIGARFSRESVKVLKNWVVTHSHHPYPTDEERESLQKITGLNKTQITNWLANARRRGKIQPTRATSPHVGRGYAQAIDVPQRRGTPGLFENMNPLQRWANSPPENEPASVTAIARAVSASGSYSATSGSGRTSPNVWNFSDDGSNRSLCNQSSASSLGTSHSSGGSFASAFSNQSRGSSIPSFVRSSRGRRRRRRAPPKRVEEQLSLPLKTFQCTFCTETFRTKHDWQRHEKSLHLSLERWICSPDGPRAVNPENGQVSCGFCGEENPDDAHIESHNFSSCTERTQEERTFYRKDHLRQHLRLVHDVKFLPWTMDKWRVTTPAIRSRCGFCGVVLDSWTVRVDHLAEHFKTGNTMADWKGDWGFEAPVLEMVENSIPPYLIHDERQTPYPFEAGRPSPGSPTNAYELVKLELQWWMTNKTQELGTTPSDLEIQQEACRVIYGAEVMLKGIGVSSSSWLCDLITSNEEAKRQAAFHPRTPGSNCLSSLRINGKSDIFENCEFEKELQDYVNAKLLLGLTAMDHELQYESCRILGRMEERSSNPSEALANWFIRMINSSASWLQDFRQRAHLPRSEDVGCAHKRSTDPKTIDSTIHNYSRLEAELGEYLQLQRSLGNEPTNAGLQRKARIIVYEADDEWNQTAADDEEWLENFRERHPPKSSGPSPTSGSSSSSRRNVSTTTQSTPTDLLHTTQVSNKSPQMNNSQSPGGSSTNSIKLSVNFLNDANCFRRLAKDLGRFVSATTSANNPNRHVPTDEELKHQARWIIYDDDDPFNQTAADNAEWLQRFKVDAGILPPESGPGLGIVSLSWNIKQGGSGFEPPYVAPNPAAMIEPLHGNPQIYLDDNAKPFESEASTANHFLRTFTQRYPAPAKIFCSRELENGLTEYVKRELQKTGVFPSDAQLQARARDIMSMQKTPCDDPTLLGKFKAALRGNLPTQQQPIPTTADFALDFAATIPASMPTTSALSAGLASSMPAVDSTFSVSATDSWPTGMDLDLNFTEQELSDLLGDVSYGLDDSMELNLGHNSLGGVGGGPSMPI
ncbi:hypothetical protein GQX73_g6391 [Xylaria multiplex]|uniref:Homeobox domain-containing protein n=1 Tax=Xylaria multiplex TaxID=323545 RepID=A0A7C8IMU0_9PEZI|nr:hypothetical protein GQX73_g6391 [Xylaria multiplex]